MTIIEKLQTNEIQYVASNFANCSNVAVLVAKWMQVEHYSNMNEVDKKQLYKILSTKNIYCPKKSFIEIV